MEISPAQCRAARALLNWNQKTLADKTGVALKTVRAFETGRTKPLGVTRAAIKQALEKAGVEFLDGDGVRLRR
jgi:DNA-binding XRE family transcriptional regulator